MNRTAAGVVVFAAGDHGYHTFRIPGIVRTRAGTLLAFAEGRRHGSGDSGAVDVLLRRSSDGGRTWAAPQTVASGTGDTVGNPTPVVDPAGGDVVLLTTANAGWATEHLILRGEVDAEDGRRVRVQRSTDDGAGWSEPVDITAAVKRPDWRWYATGPGHALALRQGRYAGRLVAPADHSDGRLDTRPDGGYGGHLLLSDDGGHTWRIGAVDPGGGEVAPNETAAAELSDGLVYVNARNQAPGTTAHRAQTTSSTGGEAFEEPYRPVPGLVTPVVQASVLAVGDRLVFSGPSDPGGRRGMALRTSTDAGRSWSDATVVSPAPAAYSDLVHLGEVGDLDDLGDVVIGLLYETGDAGPYECIRFLRRALRPSSATASPNSWQEGDG